MNQSVVVGIIAFLVVSGLFLAGTFFSRRFSRQRERVRSLVSTEGPARGERDGLSEFFSVTLPRLGTLLMPVQDETAKNTQLRTLLIQAGFYKPEHMAIFAASKMVLACVPLVGF